jgi:pseudaminic acid cytidylyltransferase
MTVAIIPARGGSKRIPRKNIRHFHGKPMIWWPIQELLKSNVVTRVIVSTDDEEIADVAIAAGAEVPFLRPASLSGDLVATAPVLAHALDFLSQEGEVPNCFCCVYATAPFIRAEFLKKGFELISSKMASAVFSVTTFPFPIQRALKIADDGSLKMLWPENELVRSQDLPEAYHDAGQFYWLNTEFFLKNNKLYAPDALPVVLPRYYVQDIDTLEDWNRAELMFSALFGGDCA